MKAYGAIWPWIAHDLSYPPENVGLDTLTGERKGEGSRTGKEADFPLFLGGDPMTAEGGPRKSSMSVSAQAL